MIENKIENSMDPIKVTKFELREQIEGNWTAMNYLRIF